MIFEKATSKGVVFIYNNNRTLLYISGVSFFFFYFLSAENNSYIYVYTHVRKKKKKKNCFFRFDAVTAFAIGFSPVSKTISLDGARKTLKRGSSRARPYPPPRKPI